MALDDLQRCVFAWLSLLEVDPLWAAIGAGYAEFTSDGVCLTAAGTRYLERLPA